MGLIFGDVVQWNPYNADTLRNKRNVLIIEVSTFQRYGWLKHPYVETVM